MSRLYVASIANVAIVAIVWPATLLTPADALLAKRGTICRQRPLERYSSQTGM
jgi:hypothetical protein